MIKIIDPHIHLFDLAAGNYQWLKPENPPFWPDKFVIEQDFTEQDLTLESPLTIAGFVHVEAGFDNEAPWREVEYLEQTCQIPFKTVAYIDICQPESNFENALNKLLEFKSVVGVRDILDDDAVEKLSSNQAIANLKTLAQHNLSFDCQFNLSCIKSTEALSAALSQLVNLSVIINHAGFPPLEEVEYQQWQTNLAKIAKFENVSVKCSGFEMADRNYKPSWAITIISEVFRKFGEDRIMLASNFPLTLFSMPYQQYWQKMLPSLPFGPSQLQKLTFANSYRIYKF